MFSGSHSSHPQLFLTDYETSGDGLQYFLIKSFSEGISKFITRSSSFLTNKFSQTVASLGLLVHLMFLLKHITNPRDLTVQEKLLIEKNEGLIMNFDIPSENDNTVDSHQRFHSQSEMAEDGKNDFLKMFLNLSEFH